MKALAWARLLRLSLAPSAAADVAAGLVIGFGGRFPGGALPWLAIAASLCVYHGGMVLNDWADRAHDRRTRPERPIPSGAISPGAALAVGLLLVGAAIALACAIGASPGMRMGVLAVLVLLYDFAPRHPWFGPLLLGACRATNLGFGLAMAGPLGAPGGISVAGALALAGLYGAYVTCASRVARLEDVADETTIGMAPRIYLSIAALLLCSPALVEPFQGTLRLPHPISFTVAALGAVGLALRAFAVKRWTRVECGRATGMALRRLLVFTAAVALLATRHGPDGWYVAAAILVGFPISAALRKLIPPT